MGEWMKRVWTMTAAVALVSATWGVARAQDGAADAEAKPAVTLSAPADATFRFRRSFSRKAECPQLSRLGDEASTVEYDAKVTTVAEDGSRTIELAFGDITGHYTTSDGTRHDVDTTGELPTIEDFRESMGLRRLCLLAGRKVTVTVNGNCTVTAVTGVREALAAAFDGTDLADMVAMIPDEDAFAEVQPFLPALPDAARLGAGAGDDQPKTDFGGGLKFGYRHAWSSEAGEGVVSYRCALRHEPGDSLPEGQTNAGEGTIEDVRDAADGLVKKRTTTVTFTGEGNYDVTTAYRETIERLAVPSDE